MLTIKATITDNTTAALQALSPEQMPEVVRRSMDTAGELIVARILTDRMSQRAAPGDRSPRTIGVVTGTARRSVRATPARIEGGNVVTEIGSNLGYVKRHEFGFKGTDQVRAHTRKGAPVRAHTRRVNVPERRMIRGGAEDNLHLVNTALITEIRRTMNH